MPVGSFLFPFPFLSLSLSAQDHQEFIAKYADYLAQKVYVYRLLGICVERRSPTESKEWARKLNGFELVKSLPALSQQFDKLLLCKPYGDTFTGQIPISALTYLVKDAFRIYSTLTVLMLGVVDHYLELDARQTKLILQVCHAFKSQNIRFKKWTIELGSCGFAHEKLFPELVPIPDALFELLQDHIQSQTGGATTSASAQPATSSTPAAGAKKTKQQAPPPKSRDPMDSDSDDESDEDVAPVRKQVSQMAVSKKSSHTQAPVAAVAVGKKKPLEPEPEEKEEGEDDESDDSEDEEERRARKAAKKARKAEKRAKKEAKRAKKAAKAAQAAAAESGDSSSDDEEQPQQPVKTKKSVTQSTASSASLSSSKRPSHQPSQEPDLFTILSQQNQQHPQPHDFFSSPSSSTPHGGFSVPSSNVFAPAASSPFGASPFAQQQQQYHPSYVSYGTPSHNSTLSHLQPLTSTSTAGAASRSGSARGSVSVPLDDNTTALGGIYDPAFQSVSSSKKSSSHTMPSADPFSELGPDLSAANSKPNKARK